MEANKSMRKTIHARHENGYSGTLYGESSMSIYRPDGHECLHTGSRGINTEEELMDLLAGMPEFFGKMAKEEEDEGS